MDPNGVEGGVFTWTFDCRGDPQSLHEARRVKLVEARHRRRETNLTLRQRTLPLEAASAEANVPPPAWTIARKALLTTSRKSLTAGETFQYDYHEEAEFTPQGKQGWYTSDSSQSKTNIRAHTFLSRSVKIFDPPIWTWKLYSDKDSFNTTGPNNGDTTGYHDQGWYPGDYTPPWGESGSGNQGTGTSGTGAGRFEKTTYHNDDPPATSSDTFTPPGDTRPVETVSAAGVRANAVRAEAAFENPALAAARGFWEGLKAGAIRLASKLPFGDSLADDAERAFQDAGIAGTWADVISNYAGDVGIAAAEQLLSGGAGNLKKLDKLYEVLQQADGLRQLMARAAEGDRDAQGFLVIAGAAHLNKRLNVIDGRPPKSTLSGTASKLDGPAHVDEAVEGAVQRAIPREGIYEFPDQSVGGKPYVGQSGNIPARVRRHVLDGRLPEDGAVKTTEVPGGQTAREIAEHRRIQELTGNVPASRSPDVANRRDPIGPRRRDLLE